MEIRPMREDDVEPLMAVCADALWGAAEAGGIPVRPTRISHFLETDPGGAWVAEHDGRPVGTAMALLREGLWGLSLLAVAEAHRTGGTGRRLVEAALGHGDGGRAAIILSSEHPAAMRIYARAGFDLRPSVSLSGLVRDPPPRPDGVREAVQDDLAWMDDVAREVRGAAYGPDLRWWLEGGPVLAVEQRGFLVAHGPKVRAVLARDEDAAQLLLEAHLAGIGPGVSAELGFLTAGQDWAVRTGLRAGLALSPDGPVFTRGALGSLRAWVPSGACL